MSLKSDTSTSQTSKVDTTKKQAKINLRRTNNQANVQNKKS